MVTLTVHSTNYYLIDCLGGWLLVDAGWVGEMAKFRSQLKHFQIDFSEIKYVMMTHHHPDHAGLIQDVKNASGARWLIAGVQVPYLPQLHAFFATRRGYTRLEIEPNDIILKGPTRGTLQSIGISLVLDSGAAFTGDLHRPDMVDEAQYLLTVESWKKLVERGAKIIYPSHGPSIPVEAVLPFL
jgi:glyoxylase-like metal-dependent hydrolase (beta-lactamase superfamily II)